MNLYLDDDSVKKSFVSMLSKTGHQTVIPAEVNLVGRPDPVHLLHAISHELVLLTRNYRDYVELHDLVLGASGHHSGILIVRQDGDSARDMSDRQIVAAIDKVQHQVQNLGDQLLLLNQWR